MSENCKYCGEFLTLIDVLGRCSTSETDHTRSIFCVDRELKALRTANATLTAEVSRLTRELSQERIEWMLVNDANDQLRQERDKGA